MFWLQEEELKVSIAVFCLGKVLLLHYCTENCTSSECRSANVHKVSHPRKRRPDQEAEQDQPRTSPLQPRAPFHAHPRRELTPAPTPGPALHFLSLGECTSFYQAQGAQQWNCWIVASTLGQHSVLPKFAMCERSALPPLVKVKAGFQPCCDHLLPSPLPPVPQQGPHHSSFRPNRL